MTDPLPDDKIPLSTHLIPYAKAIGLVCIDWSLLESTIDKFLFDLMKIENPKKFETICHSIDLRDKIHILIQLGFLAKPGDAWFAALKWCCDQIDNDLRNRRNRFIHDKWLLRIEGPNPFYVERVAQKTGIKKAPATGKFEHFTEEIGNEKPQDILDLAAEIHLMGTRLTIISFGLDGSPDWESLLEEEAPLPPPKEGSDRGRPPSGSGVP